MDFLELRDITAALDEAGVPYAVCGGVAMAIHGLPRPTKDLDLLVEPSDVERALEAIEPLGYVHRTPPMTFNVGRPLERTVQAAHKAVGAPVRLLPFRGKGLLACLDRSVVWCHQGAAIDLIHRTALLALPWAGRTQVIVGGRGLWVVSPEGLIAMKRGTGRPKDQLDIERLTALDADLLPRTRACSTS